jgi:hypoxanthine-DNA glycosylase
MQASSFKAIAGPDARVLILGTLPGAASLSAGQYYAHPRNAFWTIMGNLVGAAVALPYEERAHRLVQRCIAVWDVCASASRPGSLDTAIQTASVIPNDIAGFLSSHKHVGLICFNGVKAGELFRRLVLPVLTPSSCRIRRLTLPSTSPAYAGMSFEGKLDVWRGALAEPHRGDGL